MGQWLTAAIFFVTWFILSVIFHKSGMVHILLLAAIAVFVVQFAAYRKTRHHNSVVRRADSELKL